MSASRVVVGLASVAVLGVLLAASFALLVAAPAGAGAVAHPAPASLRMLPETVFATAPGSAVGPDDITMLPLHPGGPELVWVAYQNGINPNGTPGTPGGPTKSTIVGYSQSGTILREVNVTGKVDGLTGDPVLGAVVATVNEDFHSSIYLVTPWSGAVAHFTYVQHPAVMGNGGTDSIAIWHGAIVVSHSDPANTKQATAYTVALNYTTGKAWLTPVFFDDSMTTSAITGARYHLALTDPDTNYVMPPQSPLYAGDLMTISQGDGRLIFAQHGAHHNLVELNMTDNVSGNLPPLDGFWVKTSAHGTLFLVDNGANTIYALNTSGFPVGTVFVGEASDNANPLLGTINLATGVITPLGNTFVNPHGMMFLPA